MSLSEALASKALTSEVLASEVLASEVLASEVLASEVLATGVGRVTYASYLLAFVASALVCLGAAWRARQIPYLDTRRGLVAFFLGSGAWAATYVGFLLVGSALGKHLFYQASLLVGFSVVWAWLWFCSAYSGRGLHRNRAVRRFAAAVFLVVAALKVTNPLHGLYYGLEPSGSAFGLVVSHGMLYWVVMALSYALASTGYLMLFELFLKTETRTGPLAVLTGITALPAALNVVGYADPSLLDVTHEPLGVAVFAVGVLLAYTYQFSAVRVAGGLDSPNLMLGADGKIRDYGGGAGEAVTALGPDAVGEPLGTVLPGLAEVLGEKREVWEMKARPRSRYFQVTETSLEEKAGSRVVVLANITEQKRRQQRLGRWNNLFEKAQDLADVGAWEYDVQNDTLTWTEQVYAIHGLHGDVSLSPEVAISHYHREDRPRIRRVFTRAIREGKSYDEELRIRRPGGEIRWVRALGEPQTGGGPQTEEGAVAYVRGAFKDITDQKRRENTLRKLRKKYQGLLEGAPDAIFVADADSGQIIEANQAAASLLGSPVDAITGRNQSEIHPPGQADQYRSLFEQSMREAKEAGKESGVETGAGLVRQLKDGSQAFVETSTGRRVPVEISTTLVELEGEEALEGTEALVGIFRDITEQISREEALRKAKEEAEKASRAKSSLLANMSHEIRTPLTSIIGFAEAIGEDREAASRFAPLIEKSGKRLLQTLDGVLNLSKLEAGQMELTEETVDLSAEAEALAEELIPQAEDAGVDCRIETNGTPVRARADRGGVQVALRNLLSNAIKYTEEGGEVWIRAYSTEGTAVLEVEDTGIGMDPETAERLFEPFRQASEGFDREYEGTGVGLAVTREATEQMGGTIEVETEKGEGSRFIARFPQAGDAGGGEED